MKHLSIDIETYSSIDLKKSGLYKYAQSPDFEILLFAYSADGGEVCAIDLTAPGAEIPEDIRSALFSPATIKHAFNAAFEWYCLSQHFKLTEAETAEWVDQWRCTMLHSQYLGFPASLADAGKAVGLPQDKQKMAIGKTLIRYFCKPCSPTKTNGGRTRNLPHHDAEKWKLFTDYNAQDVVTEMAIEQKLSKFPVPAEVQAQWELDQRINLRGVQTDIALVDAAIAMSEVHTAQLLQEAKDATGLLNPNSVTQLRVWLYGRLGEDIPDLRKETVSDLLTRDDLPEKVRRVLEIRQELGKSSVKKYAAIREAACSDNRVRGMMAFYGANRTGREAGRLVQPQNLPHDTVTDEKFARYIVKEGDPDTVKLAYRSVPHTLSALIRTALIAGDGCALVDADFSAIEARVIAWLAGEKWVLEVFRTHGKIYEATASQMFNIPIEKIKKGEPEYAYRAKGKVATLALGYQGGPGALIAMGAVKNGIPEEELPEIVQRWREENPAIQRFWYKVEEAAITAVEEVKAIPVPISDNQQLVFSREVEPENGLDFLTIKLPSGRKLYYDHPHMGENRFGNPSLCHFGQNGASNTWSTTETYGGKIAENICQAVARDCLFYAMENLTRAGYRVVFDVHDEVVLEVPNGTEDDLQKVIEIMRRSPPWAPNLPLNADGWVGEFFHKD